MKYLVGISCEKCQKKFFTLNNDVQEEKVESKVVKLCSQCLKVEGLASASDEVKDSIKEVLSVYSDAPSSGRYKIEEIDDEG